MKVLFTERPHARIPRLDSSKAEAYPGIAAVFTARNVPVNEYSLQKGQAGIVWRSFFLNERGGPW